MSANTNLPSKILVVDDDQADTNKVEQLLSNVGIKVMKANNWEAALYLFNQNHFDLCIVELELDDMLGTALVQKWLSHDIESKRHTGFIVSMGNTRSTADEALAEELGDVHCIFKPFTLASLLSTMTAVMVAKKRSVGLEAVKSKLIDPLISQGKKDKAIAVAKDKLFSCGKQGKLLTAQVYETLGELKDALVIVQELSDQNPNSMLYLNEVAKLQMKLGDLNASREAFEQADKVAPLNIERMYGMAELYLKQRMPEKSVEKFKEIMNLTPENKDIKYGFYEQLAEAGFEQHAQSFCRDTSTPKELIRHYNNKGVLFSKQERYIDAIDEYKKAERLIPGASELYRVIYNRALAHINLKHIDHLHEAHELLEEVLKLKPDFEKAKDKIKITEKFYKSKTAS